MSKDKAIDTAALRALWEQASVEILSSHDVPALCDEVDRLRAVNESGGKMIRALTEELVKAGAERADAQRERNGWRKEAWHLTQALDEARAALGGADR